jgi:glyoxylase-like metal-dependent hydrolase (beta-lactamase superfamily II)
MKKLAVLLAGLFLSGSAFAENKLFSFDFAEVADNVWVGVRPDSPRFPVMGNTTFVISDEGVVVYDGGGAPAMAEQIIAKIRSLTSAPVTHVIISHWHGDHNFGIYRFAEEYPDVKIIAHRFTAKVIDSPRIAYIDFAESFFERNKSNMQAIVETGLDKEGNEVPEYDRVAYAGILEDEDLIDGEQKRFRVTRPDVLIDDKLSIESGDRTIEVMYMGDANTEGDIVMWLPQEKIVATGDIVVLPSPYAFNVPPRAWAATLGNINELNYSILVPGHGPIQRDTSYVDLIIEAATSIADQRDSMLAAGKPTEEVEAALDFSAFEKRFTGGDEYVHHYYDAYFEQPFRKAAMKALTGEPMVAIDGPEEISFDDERWQIEALESERLFYLGQDALKIKGGSATLADLDIKNGIVEFDIAVSSDRGFAGLIFRRQDPDNYEHFYIRPHQSGNPDANQYTPVFNGVSAWQLYHGPEYAVPTSYRYDEWMHIKVVFADTRADIYIDSDEPVLRINDLKRGAISGLIGVNSANFSHAYFANLEVSKLANAYILPARATLASEAANGRITSWAVSEPFDHDVLEAETSISDEIREAQRWTRIEAESTGITNLASVPVEELGKNTRFARLRLSSDSHQTRLLRFGYSDSAKVYVNGELRYAGDNTYMSRDYRFLGTIGLFDAVPLQLEKGENEILIAVTEAFGGWGIMGELDSVEGLQIQYPDVDQ